MSENKAEQQRAIAESYWSDYKKIKSVHKVAAIHGVSHSTVHRNLKKFGYKLSGAKFTEDEDRATEEDVAARVMKQVRTKTARGNLHPQNRNKCSWKQQWAEFGGKRNYYRSQWELNYARYLEMLKCLGEIKEWEHEPDTFWFEGVKRGTVSYLPDFKVTENNGAIAYHEVKGWMDARSKTKIRRMAKYHPDVKLIVVDAKAYRALSKQVSGLVDGWV